MKFDDLKKTFEPAPEGTHTGILTLFATLGAHATKFGASTQAAAWWTLPDVETATGDPCTIFQTIWNLSLRSKAFREVATALMGDEPLGDRSLRELLGRPARLTIVHTESETTQQVYANIASIRPLKPGTPRPRTPEDLLYFSLSPEEFSADALNSLPIKMQNKIRESATYQETLSALAAKKKPIKELVEDELPSFA